MAKSIRILLVSKEYTVASCNEKELIARRRAKTSKSDREPSVVTSLTHIWNNQKKFGIVKQSVQILKHMLIIFNENNGCH